MEQISATIVGEPVTIQDRLEADGPRPRMDDPVEFAIVQRVYLPDDNADDVGARHRRSRLGTNEAR